MSEIQDLKMESFQRLCELCAELKLKSPHPSRPHIPKAVEPTTLSSIHYLFECIFAKETQNIASEDEQATFIAKKSNALCDLCTFVRNAAAMDHENQHAIDSSNITTDTATASHNQKLADLAIDCKLAHRIVELLGLLNINLPRIQRLSTRSSTATEERQQQDKEEGQTKSIERLFMLKCDLIQIIGNISYKHKAIQDLMRELDGLSLVLDNMRIDENHPFIKEYAIVALKWLLDNNKESHEYVKNMEASKPMLDPSIAASGFQMDVDDKGKISVKKADKQ
ncbi:copper transport protein [Coemansia sp. RSA 1813]|nr:copper transport protein [Coemansia sp. RSA 1813]